MGIFSNANTAAFFQGQQLLQDREEKQADIEGKKAQAANMQMSNLMKQQELKNKSELVKFMQSQQATNDEPVKTAAELASGYQKASAFAASRGDFDGMEKMEKLAKTQTDIASKELVQKEKTQQDNAEELSTAAQDVATNPSPENHKKLFNSAIKAGIPPDQIPMPGTAGYAAFANQAALAPLKGEKRLEYLEKVRQHQEQETAIAEERKTRHQEHADAAKQLAADREGRSADRKEALALRQTLAQSLLDTRKAKSEAVEAGGAIQHRQTVQAVNVVNEATRGLGLISQMGVNQTSNVFGHLQNPDTILKALEKTGTNKLTPEMQQIYQTATKGLGLELAQVATAGSGRTANRDQIREMGEMVEAKPGDKQFEVMFKLANAADFVKTRLEAVPKSSDPNIQAIRERAEKELAKYPAPADILKAAEKAGVKLGKTQKQGAKMRDVLDNLKTTGTSVVPDSIKSILDKYPATATH